MARPVHHYRPHQTAADDLEAILVGRELLLQEILERLARWEPKASRQHHLLIGPRGIGKTHVLRVLEHRVSREPTRRWTALCLPEEQYAVTSVADLLLETLRSLAERVEDPTVTSAHNKLRFDDNNQRVVDLSLDAFRSFSSRGDRGVVLMVENLNRLLETQIRQQSEVHLLRKILTEEEWLTLICTSPTYLNAVTRPEEPLFEFFQVHFLEELSPEQQRELLKKRAVLDDNTAFLDYLTKYRSRLQAIYHFSGGNPRLTLMLYDLVAHQALSQVRFELDALLDKLTPFYQDRMKELAPQEAKLLEVMAMLPEGCGPSELANEVRMGKDQVSALLSRLERSGYVRRHSQNRKQTAWIIPERFFRIWHQMSHSRAARGRVQYLLEFFSTWYATRAERDEVWSQLVEGLEHGVQDGDETHAQDVAGFMDYVATISEGGERFERHFERLRRLVSSGDMQSAHDGLGGLDQEFPHEGPYFLHKGDFLASVLGRHEEAFTAYKRAFDLNSDRIGALYNQAVALDKLGKRAEVTGIYVSVAELLTDMEGSGAAEGAQHALLSLIREDADSRRVRIAAYVVSRTNAAHAVPELLEILRSPAVPWRRQHCATALGLLGKKEAIPTLVECLEDEASNVRGSAATALGRIGATEAVPALIECLTDHADNVRGSAATALGRIGAEEAVPALIKCLEDQANDVRGSAAAALGRIGATEAVPALIECLADHAGNVRGSAATALARVGSRGRGTAIPRTVDAILAVYKERPGGLAPRALLRLLQSAFGTQNLEFVRSAVDCVVSKFPGGEALCAPHLVALDYLDAGRSPAILDRQHPEMREAVELLVSAFDSGASNGPPGDPSPRTVASRKHARRRM